MSPVGGSSGGPYKACLLCSIRFRALLHPESTCLPVVEDGSKAHVSSCRHNSAQGCTQMRNLERNI